MSKKKPRRSTKTTKRADHSIGIRVSPAELIGLQEAIVRLSAASGIDVKLGAYAKHAVLSHARLRSMEADVRALHSEIFNAGPDGPHAEIAGRLAAVLGGALL
jgi:hypothetical protein